MSYRFSSTHKNCACGVFLRRKSFFLSAGVVLAVLSFQANASDLEINPYPEQSVSRSVDRSVAPDRPVADGEVVLRRKRRAMRSEGEGRFESLRDESERINKRIKEYHSKRSREDLGGKGGAFSRSSNRLAMPPGFDDIGQDGALEQQPRRVRPRESALSPLGESPSGNVKATSEKSIDDVRSQLLGGVDAQAEGVDMQAENIRIKALSAQKRRADRRSILVDRGEKDDPKGRSEITDVVDVAPVPTQAVGSGSFSNDIAEQRAASRAKRPQPSSPSQSSRSFVNKRPVASSKPSPSRPTSVASKSEVLKAQVEHPVKDEKDLFDDFKNASSTVDLNELMLQSINSRKQGGGVVSRRAGVSQRSGSAELPMKTVAPEDIPATEVAVTLSKPVKASAPRWSAVEGADLRDTIFLWAQEANVDFVWNGSANVFDVTETVVLSGDFQDAVRTLLDQYKSHMVRPLGKLFINPDNGRQVLVVDVKRGV